MRQRDSLDGLADGIINNYEYRLKVVQLCTGRRQRIVGANRDEHLAAAFVERRQIRVRRVTWPAARSSTCRREHAIDIHGALWASVGRRLWHHHWRRIGLGIKRRFRCGIGPQERDI